MVEGCKEAFCILLWVRNGGTVDNKGRPISPNRVGQLEVITNDDLDEEMAAAEHPTEESVQERRYARGSCTRPYDCTSCHLMQDELANYDPSEVVWVCPDCLHGIFRSAKKAGIKITAPGHYSEGICEFLGCSRPATREEAEGLPGMPGGRVVELPPGFSRYRQLLIGKINHNSRRGP